MRRSIEDTRSEVEAWWLLVREGTRAAVIHFYVAGELRASCAGARLVAAALVIYLQIMVDLQPPPLLGCPCVVGDTGQRSL